MPAARGTLIFDSRQLKLALKDFPSKRPKYSDSRTYYLLSRNLSALTRHLNRLIGRERGSAR